MTWRPSLRHITGVDVLLLYALVVISVIALAWWLHRVVKAFHTGGKRSTILQPSLLVVLLLALSWVYLLFDRTSGVLPKGDLSYLGNHLCWPYNVNVYCIDEWKMDSAFHHYPLDSYFPESEEFAITHWTNYQEIDTALWNGMDGTLKDCVGNTDLYRSVLGGDPIYFAGMYRMKYVSDHSRKRVYERILFLDATNNRLHVFKNINKVF